MSEPPKLLRATLTKVDAVLGAIRAAAEIDFSYPDSRAALMVLAEEFEDIRRELLDPTTAAAELSALRGFCARALETIFQNLPLVGFLARSASPAGAPELHGPLRRLTAQAIGEDAQLVISSEWDFSPFTLLYPQSALSHFVLVGLPHSEAANALVAPLAGHELGHNVWRRHGVRDRVIPLARQKLRDSVLAKWEEFQKWSELKDQAQLDDLIGQAILSEPFRSVVAQSEELFSDLVGLKMFREGYLLAFEYLLAPGTSAPRNPDYPRIENRAAFLADSAELWGIGPPANFRGSFSDETNAGAHPLQTFADATVQSLLPDLRKCATELATAVALRADDIEVNRHAGRLRRLVPAIGASHLGMLILAGWRVYLSDLVETGNSPLSQLKRDEGWRVLNDLLLKSIEVFEIEQLQNA